MPFSKPVAGIGTGLGITAIVLFLILGWLGITAEGVMDGAISLVMTLISAIAVSIVMAVATREKEKLLTYVPTVFIIVIIAQMVTIALQMILPGVF